MHSYVEWSSHEPEEGHFDFEGQQDLVRFLRIAHKLGFMVILRPAYLFYVDRYLTKVFEQVRPLLIGNGGPIIMLQVENEYGFYKACDSSYMVHLRDLAWAHLGRDVVLFTADSSDDNMIKCGSVDGVLTTVNFGTGMEPRRAFSRKWRHQMSGPLMNSELYVGWLDHWGEPHHLVNATHLAQTIRTLLAMKASFNLYMFHGGTNFGFKTGANMAKGFQPQLTSYDYDAPINEAGDATEKFKVIRDAIAEAFIGIVSREEVTDALIDVKPNQTLSILVENQGRINFGNFISDRKGIVKNVTLDYRRLEGWEMIPIRLSNAVWLREPGALERLRRLSRDPPESSGRGLSVYATTFALNESQRLYDSFLRLDQWTKGVAFLNGFNLGRYWTAAGPQTTLYVPAQIFKDEGNVLVLMELEAVHSESTGHGSAEFVSEPKMNAPVRWPV
ncbi:hypothetical protein HPB49_001066 [Dermacentor silvarum]|uniref:Uncharacterized protein n=1 Tax=Dermacentor silvarum TaxID=543639 RepID=A0ACB8CUT0_DERSI|nr:hypothetical protein HPB49_001066 [Dermacentor silvarum]